MMKLPRLSGSKVVKLLSKQGFEIIRQKGSHIFLRHSDGRITVVPNHKEIDKGTLREIIRQAGLTRDEFLELV
ncbi:type II toxin-antitoxin system HicA family toxin [Patescibacteria group bacterium]|nr:type II toxin-antitoxin system HicA family toxin [Patescibacteria group bacterium]